MNNNYILLSLDPMFSPLHSKIAKLLAKERYAVTSCLSKKIYLLDYSITLASQLIRDVDTRISEELLSTIKGLETYHHAYVSKVEGRELQNEELEYMAKFYIGIRKFIVDRKINLVLLHNDTRWYHAIAIRVCQELGIKYLVTEQGLIRPYTTVLDKKGCNANADVNYLSGINYKQYEVNKIPERGRHDSILSMFVFGLFLLGFAYERWFGRKTCLRYMHNNYSIGKYIQRIKRKFFHKKHRKTHIDSNSILLFLQLENDSQMLVHSRFSDNKQVIELSEKIAQSYGCKLAIKRHPLDVNTYNVSTNSYFVEGENKYLSEKSQLVLSVNSSAVIDVMKTSTPLLLLGESLYAREGIGVFYKSETGGCTIAEAIKTVSVTERLNFLQFLNNRYLLQGAGFSYNKITVQYKLNSLLHYEQIYDDGEISSEPINEL